MERVRREMGILSRKPAFCANCIEEREDLEPKMRKGRQVWLCPDCRDPVGALRIYEVRDQTGPLAGPRGARDGCKNGTGHGGR